MTVKELIERLHTFPGDKRVVVQGYEDGYSDVWPESVGPVAIELNAHDEWWNGRHGEARGLFLGGPVDPAEEAIGIFRCGADDERYEAAPPAPVAPPIATDVDVFLRRECIFRYCPDPSRCREECAHKAEG